MIAYIATSYLSLGGYSHAQSFKLKPLYGLLLQLHMMPLGSFAAMAAASFEHVGDLRARRILASEASGWAARGFLVQEIIRLDYERAPVSA